jgi:voltage-gated potassium channel Kch
MSKQALSSLQKHLWRWLIGATFAITLLLGGYGYYDLYKETMHGVELWLNVPYKAISLFYGGGAVNEPGLALAFARMLARIFTSWAIAWTAMVFLNRQFRHWWLIKRATGHYVICGLGDRGFALAEDLLKKRHTVIAIELSPSNPNIERLRKLGGAVIEGDARDEPSLSSSALSRATHLVTLTESDATNLEVLNLVKKGIMEEALKCHIHITNRENRVLFDVGGRYFPPIKDGIEISLVNLYEGAAQALFQEHTLGNNTDTVTPGAKPVRLLITGFGGMGEAILIEAMLMGHFCNHVPIEITVLDKDAESHKESFFGRYWEVQSNLVNHPEGAVGLGLWKLDFTDKLEDAGPLDSYTDIFACHDCEDSALVAIHNLCERLRSSARGSPQTRIFAHAPSGRSLTNSGIKTFGSKQDICCKEFVIDSRLEHFARRAHETYARKRLDVLASQDPAVSRLVEKLGTDAGGLNQALRAYDASQQQQSKKLAWENMSLFLKGSNKAEMRHLAIKASALGLGIPSKLATLVDHTVAEVQWPMLDTLENIDGGLDLANVYPMLTHAKQATGLDNQGLKGRIDALAEAEHTRWNAYLVLNNFRYGPKDESRRTHDCLLSWHELSREKPDRLVYDYKNVYQIAGLLDAI